jgi:uncharacterized RDD family membrane protein YckC
MTMHRFARATATTLVAVFVTGAALGAQDPPPTTRRTPSQTQKPVPPAPAPTPPPRFEDPQPERRDPTPFEDRLYNGMRHRPQGFRLFQDFTLRAGEATWEVFSVLANVRIDGTVRNDVGVVMGDATIGSTAVIEGSLAVIGGSATIAQGAKISGDLVVIGGTVNAPNNFAPGRETVVVGTPVIGDSLRALTPWLTRGLLLGRLIVPDLSWVWTFVVINFLFGLVLNQMFVGQVGRCADTVVRRPGAAFFVGLLVILLAGPALAIVAVTVIGLPFALVALVAAAIIGKLGVTRAIGRSIAPEADPLDRSQALRSYVIGAVAVTLSYMVPVLGLAMWALLGVFGLGTATMTFLTSVRRERPAAQPAAPAATAPPAPPPPVPPSGGGEPVAPPAAPAFVSVTPPLAVPPEPFRDDLATAGPSVAAYPPLVTPEGVVGPSPKPAVAETGILAYPRASFLDRLAAFALDAILVAIVAGFLFDVNFRFRGEEMYLPMLLIYHIVFWAWKGTTLGGIICSIRMVRASGETPRFIDALVRGLSAIFSVAALGIGCLWMLSDAQRQMWHDKIAGTVVLKLPREMVVD